MKTIFHREAARELMIPATISECPIGPRSGVRAGVVVMAGAGKVVAVGRLPNPMNHVQMAPVRGSDR